MVIIENKITKERVLYYCDKIKRSEKFDVFDTAFIFIDNKSNGYVYAFHKYTSKDVLFFDESILNMHLNSNSLYIKRLSKYEYSLEIVE